MKIKKSKGQILGKTESSKNKDLKPKITSPKGPITAQKKLKASSILSASPSATEFNSDKAQRFNKKETIQKAQE